MFRNLTDTYTQIIQTALHDKAGVMTSTVAVYGMTMLGNIFFCLTNTGLSRSAHSLTFARFLIYDRLEMEFSFIGKHFIEIRKNHVI